MQELLIIGNIIRFRPKPPETAQRFGLNWQCFLPKPHFLYCRSGVRFFASKPIIKLLEERKERIAQSVADSERIKEELRAAEDGRQKSLRQLMKLNL